MLVDEIKDDPRKDAQDYAERVARGFRPEIPWRWPSQLVELIQACWHQVCEQGQKCGGKRGEQVWEDECGVTVWEGKSGCGTLWVLCADAALVVVAAAPALIPPVWTLFTPLHPSLTLFAAGPPHAPQLHRRGRRAQTDQQHRPDWAPGRAAAVHQLRVHLDPSAARAL